jgi:hypothetical protein
LREWLTWASVGMEGVVFKRLNDAYRINDAHVARPGLAVVEVAAADDETAFAVQELLAARWGIAPADRTTREPGEPGVRLRCFLVNAKASCVTGCEADAGRCPSQSSSRVPGSVSGRRWASSRAGIVSVARTSSRSGVVTLLGV